MHFIENIQKRRDLTFAFTAVNAVCDSDIANVVRRKIDIRVLPRKDVVSTKSGKVLGNHTIDLSVFDIIKHPLKSGTVIVCAAVTIIHIFIVDMQALFMTILREHLSLR